MLFLAQDAEKLSYSWLALRTVSTAMLAQIIVLALFCLSSSFPLTLINLIHISIKFITFHRLPIHFSPRIAIQCCLINLEETHMCGGAEARNSARKSFIAPPIPSATTTNDVEIASL
jgi:tellurite resistance protein TehA-like permease